MTYTASGQFGSCILDVALPSYLSTHQCCRGNTRGWSRGPAEVYMCSAWKLHIFKMFKTR